MKNECPKEYAVWCNRFTAAKTPKEISLLNKEADKKFGKICQNCRSRKKFHDPEVCKNPTFETQGQLF